MPDPKRKIAPADATRVKPASKPDVARMQADMKSDRTVRDKADSTLKALDGESGVPGYKLKGPGLRAAKDSAQTRMDARSDSIVQTRANTKKVAKDLFDVEDDVDNMRKTAASGLHRARNNGGR